MSKTKTTKSNLAASMGGRSASQITPDEAMIYALSTNMMAIAFADVPDIDDRIMRARQQIVRNQPSISLGMRRQLDDVESFVLDAIKNIKANTPTVH